MTQRLDFGGKEFISAKEAAVIAGYTSDYVGQLCRGGKVESKMVGRTWFVSKDSILKHKELSFSQSASKVFKFISESSESQSPDAEILKKNSSSLTVSESLLSSASRDALVLQPKKEAISTGSISDSLNYKSDSSLFIPELKKDFPSLPPLAPKPTRLPSKIKTASFFSKLSKLHSANPDLLAKVGAFALSATLVFGTFFLIQTDYPKRAYQALSAALTGATDFTAKIPLYAHTGALVVSKDLASLYDGASLAVLNVAETSRQVVSEFSSDPSGFLSGFLASSGSSISNFVSEEMNSFAVGSRMLAASTATTLASGLQSSLANLAVNVYNDINSLFYRTGSALARIFISKLSVTVATNPKPTPAPVPIAIATTTTTITRGSVFLPGQGLAFGPGRSASPSLPSYSGPAATTPPAPVVERFTERVLVGDISRAEVEAKLNQLNNALSAKIYAVSAASTASTGANATYINNVYQNAVAPMNRIDNLQNVTISNPTVSTGTFTNPTITGGHLSGLAITGSSFSGTTGDFSGNVSIAGNLTASTGFTSYSASVAPYFTATSTTATSTFALGGVAIGTSTPFGNGLLTVGTSSPLLYVDRNSGNIAVGTTTTGAANLNLNGRLWVGGVIAGSQDAGNNDTPLLIQGSSNNAGRVLRMITPDYNTNTSTGTLFLNGFGATSGNTYGQIQVITAGGTLTNGNLALNPSGGNVGIGTTTPATALDIFSNSNVFGGAHLGQLLLEGSANNIGLQIHNYQTGGRIWGISSTGNSADISGGKFRIQDITGSADRLVIDSSGNVGIGTTSPGTTLGVMGRAVIADFVNASTFQATSTTATSTFSTGGLTVGTSQFVVQQTSGNVGIGTTSPAQLLHLSSAQPDLIISHTNTSNYGRLVFREGGTENAGVTYIGSAFSDASRRNVLEISNNNALGVIDFFTNGTEKMRITTSGNVGIGTTTPATTLSVVGSGYLTVGLGVGKATTTTGALDISGNGVFGGFASASIFNATSTTATSTFSGGVILAGSAGNVGIGTTSPSAKLSLTGNGTGTGRAFAFSSSDNLEKLLILDNGRVSIGGASGGVLPVPQTPLEITTTTEIPAAGTQGGSFSIQRGDNALGLFIGVNSLGDAWLQAQRTDSVNYNRILLNPNGGNLGIGTTTPAQLLSVAGHCVTGDTRLRRRRRKKGAKGDADEDYDYDEVAIKDIKEGDEIASLNEKTGRIVWSRVNALMDMGVKPIYKFTTASGKTIRTTGNHPYLVLPKEIQKKHPNLSAGATLTKVIIPEAVTISKRVIAFIDYANIKSWARNKGRAFDLLVLKEILSLIGVSELMFYYGADSKNEKILKFLNALKKFGYAVVTKPIQYFRITLAELLAQSVNAGWFNALSHSIKNNLIKEANRLDAENLRLQVPKANFDVEITIDAIKKARNYDHFIFFSGDSDFAPVIEELNKAGKRTTVVAGREFMSTILRDAAETHARLEELVSIVPELVYPIGADGSYKKPTPANGSWRVWENCATSIADLFGLSRVAVDSATVKDGRWTKAAEIREGQEIAVQSPDGKTAIWEKVMKIERLPDERVYDIEVEGTHNFIGNDIVAHNTYLTGGLGVGRATTTTGVLDVSGNGVFGGFASASTFNATSTTATSTLQALSAANFANTAMTAGSVPFFGAGGYMRQDNSNLFWDATNARLGIGTTSPAALLSVAGNGYITGNLSVGGGAGGAVSNPTDPIQAQDFSFANVFGNSTNGSLAIKTLLGGSLTEKMRIDNNGNVGIGTTSPATTLSVSGNTYLTGGLGVGKATTTTGALDVSGNGVFGGFANASTFNATSTTATSTFSTGGLTVGTNQFVVQQNSGNVGIGTASPTEFLDINSSIASNVRLKLTASNTGSATSFSQYPNANSGGAAYYDVGTVGVKSFFRVSNASLLDTTAMTMTPAGNIGIGTTSPASLLSVAGTGYFTGGLGAGANSITTGAIPSGTLASVVNSSSYTSSISLENNNATVGTGAGIRFKVDTASVVANIKYLVTTAGSSGDLTFETTSGSTGEKMRITGAGNVGIGITAPTTFLTVSKTYAEPTGGISSSTIAVFTNNNAANATSSISILSRSSGASSINFGTELAEISGQIAYFRSVTAPRASTAGSMVFNTLGTDKMLIDGNGNVGIGTTSPASPLSVVGDVMLPSLVTGTNNRSICWSTTDNRLFAVNAACTTSSIRFKENVNNLSYGIKDVMKLRPVFFNYKAAYDTDTSRKIGFIAEEVVPVIPEVGVYDDKGVLFGLDYPKLTAVLAKAIQQIGSVINLGDATTSAASITIDAAGNVGIGTSTPGYKLEVEGDVAATSFVNISTRTAKKDIVYVSDDDKRGMAEKIRNIRIAEYRYNGESEAAPLRLGLIAEEAPPEVLSASGKGVDIYKFSTFILAGVQEQQKRVESLELRVAKLEALVGSTTPENPKGLTFGGVSLASLLSSLQSFGVTIENGIAHFKNVLAEALTVGSAGNAAGITLYDTVTKAPYCLTIENGVTKTAAGVCGAAPAAGAATSTSAIADTTPPVITVIGANPAEIIKGTTYVDLGVTVVDPAFGTTPANTNLGFHTFGLELINTSIVGTYTLTYTATDQAGNTATSTRAVIVSDLVAPVVSAPVVPVATSTSAVAAPTPTPTPTPTAVATATTTPLTPVAPPPAIATTTTVASPTVTATTTP